MGKLGFLQLVAVVAVMPACSQPAGPPAPAPPPFVDGTRLKAVHYEIEGAPPFFLGWYDSELGVDCSFMNENLMNQPVCFPVETWQPPFTKETFLFTDSACSAQVVGTDFPGEAGYFIRGAEPDGFSCDPPTPARLFRVGDVVPSDTPLYLLEGNTSPGICRPATAAEIRFRELRFLGPEIPADALVRGTLGHAAGPTRIVPFTIAGSDGSMQGAITSDPSVLAWDNQRHEMVSVSTLSGPDRRWYPVSYADASYAANAECSARAAIGVNCGDMPSVASLTSVDSCGRPTVANVYALGPRLSEPVTLYSGYAQIACTQIDGWPANDPLISAFSVGAEIPLTRFAGAIEVHTGAGQLQVVEQRSPGGPATAALGFFDSVRGEPCAVTVPAADDQLRCIPQTFNFTGTLYFADAACAMPLLSDVTSSVCAPTPTLAARDEWIGDTGQVRRHVYPVGEPYLGNVYFQVPGTPECFDAGSGVGLGLYTTGPEIPAATFAAVKHVRPN